ncbi:hypothetical protein [Pedobacter sp.]|uniref:hypothetical protein n=1 Tax=Pedobacter sp. TaxID=1411316 RepID=UPI003BABBEF2
MDIKIIAIVICSIFLVFLLFKEITRRDKSKLTWRILASVLSVVSFLFLIIPLKYKTVVKQSLNEINLITAGAEADSISKIKDIKYTFTDENYPQLKGIKTTQIPDLVYFLKTHPEINKINIYGYGLDEGELENLKSYQINFHPTNKISGIISANWPSKLKSPEQLLVQGIYKNSTENNIKLLLKGFGNSVDSITIKPNSSANFSFKNQPKQIGKAVFSLIAFSGKDTLSKEHVPFIVNEQPEMKVLILGSFPDFEYKFLKKWLVDNHYPLAYRSKISKDKYTTDFLNISNISLSSISATTLKAFDVLIIDEDELSSISASEKIAIQTALNNGLGVIVRISNPKSSGVFSDKFSRFESPIQKDKGLISSYEDVKLSKLPVDQSVFLTSSDNNQIIITETSGKILAASKLNGLGKLTATTLSTTYNWMLAGKEADYATYWSSLLSKTARKKSENLSVKVFPQFPVVNEKTNFTVDLAENNKLPTIKINNLPLSPRQNMELPFQWDVTDWPKVEGWNTLTVNQTPTPVFIYSKESWQTLKNYSKINQTENFIRNNKSQITKNAISEQITTNEVSKWWVLALFIIATGFLWFESRILKKN